MVLSLPGMATVALLTDRVCTGAGSRPRGAEARCIDDKRPEVFARQDLQVTRIRAISLTMRNDCPICRAQLGSRADRAKQRGRLDLERCRALPPPTTHRTSSHDGRDWLTGAGAGLRIGLEPLQLFVPVQAVPEQSLTCSLFWLADVHVEWPRDSQGCNAVRGGNGFAERAIRPFVPAGNLAAARADMIGRPVHPGLADDDVTGPDRDTLPAVIAAGEVAVTYLFTPAAASGTVHLFLTRTCGKAINAAP